MLSISLNDPRCLKSGELRASKTNKSLVKTWPRQPGDFTLLLSPISLVLWHRNTFQPRKEPATFTLQISLETRKHRAYRS